MHEMDLRLGNLRLAIVVGVIVCITLFIATLGMERTRHAKEALDHLSTAEVERQVLGERWSAEARLNVLRTITFLRSHDTPFNERLEANMSASDAEVVRMEERIRSLVPEVHGQLLLDRVAAAATAWHDRRSDLMDSHKLGKDVAASVHAELVPLGTRYSQTLQDFNEFIDAELVENQTAAARSATGVEWTLSVGAALAIALGLGVVYMSIRAEQVKRRAERHVEHLQNHDALTGLANRAVLQSRLDAAIETAASTTDGGRVTVAVLGLDAFKEVNDNLGLPVGDEVLKVVGQRLVNSVRGTDTVVRLGGDEFAILFSSEFPMPTDALASLHRIVRNIAEQILVGTEAIHTSCSIGIATFPSDGKDGESLLKNANAAMYEAKATGGNRFEIYKHQMNANSAMRFRLQAALADAIANDELYIDYQPQIDLRTNRPFGVEALLRWRHSEMGLIPPGTFIPVAEQTGMIVEIGEWVLREACLQSVAWRRMGLPPIIVAVNVSARQFRNRNFVARVTAVLEETGALGSDIELELTESMLMNDVDSAVSLMHELRALGFHLSIDDFGTGYSSLAALQTFPISRLKIDRAFVKCIESESQDQPITSAIIDLGHRLDLKVIAEGIETPAQLSFLRHHGCDEVQGFMFSRPVTPAKIEEILREPEPFADVVEPPERELALAADHTA